MKPIDLQVEGTKQGAIEIARNRMIILMALFTIGFLTVAVKLISVGVFQAIPEDSNSRSVNQNPVIMARADIVDRNGIIVATNLKTPSLGVNPYKINDPQLLSYKIAEVLPSLKQEAIFKKLTSNRRHVWIKRTLTPKQMFEINRLGEPGLVFSAAEKRVYPQGRLLSHVLGSVDIDNKARTGVEAFFNDRLTDPMRSEDPLYLSIDMRLQYILNQELSDFKEKFSAKGAAGIILDANSGEILALSSLPDFDPNETAGPQNTGQLNRALQGVYELGSGFKTFTLALGLDSKVINLSSRYDATKSVRVSGFTIHDDHAKNRWLSVPEIFVYSSNIGTLKIAQDIGIEHQKEFFQKLGLFRKTDVEVYEAASPLLPLQWGPTELVTTSYGHGIAVTPLHLVNGVAAIVNGGRLNPATLLRKDIAQDESFSTVRYSDQVPRSQEVQVISPKTSEIMRNLLQLVVEYGTGKNAKVDGYSIGGKTGTAIKAVGGGYNDHSVISSFVSVFPVDHPKYVIFAMLDEPQGIKETFNMASGGWTAAPLVGNIIRRIGPLLGIAPVNKKKIIYEDLILVYGIE